METNFFKQTADLHLQGDLQITIKQQDAILIVSVLLKNDTCGDDARKVGPPILLKGTAHEIDEGFFANIAAPLQTTSQLFVNMEAYLKAQETAQQQSKMEQQKISKETKAQDEKTKKYEAAIKKPEELASEGKFREAWAKYPDPLDHPERADIIRKRKAELSSKFAPDLSASAAMKPAPENADNFDASEDDDEAHDPFEFDEEPEDQAYND